MKETRYIYEFSKWWFATFERLEKKPDSILAPASGTLYSKSSYSLADVIEKERSKGYIVVVEE